MNELRKEHNILNSGVCMIPHVDKRDKGGEDAYVVSADMSLIAVADGVGGWNRRGVDPALFSNELCGHLKTKYENAR